MHVHGIPNGLLHIRDLLLGVGGRLNRVRRRMFAAPILPGEYVPPRCALALALALALSLTLLLVSDAPLGGDRHELPIIRPLERYLGHVQAEVTNDDSTKTDGNIIPPQQNC